ncbi:MAG: nucleoside deaminase [Anaerolineales bacterium]|nr:nucleoside deaminase [Anaerolineales bacterium]
MWHSLTPPWQACLELAWEAYCDGTVPIGAVVADAGGRVIARGRNRIHNEIGPQGTVFNHQLAHAELNAILQFDSFAKGRNACVLYTTMEPCPLCLGAFYMSGMRTLCYAARDPYAGSTDLIGANWYMAVKPIEVFGPHNPSLETILLAIQVEFDLRDRGEKELNGQVLTRWRAAVPLGVALGEQIYRSGELRKMRERGAFAAEVIMNLCQQSMELSVP